MNTIFLLTLQEIKVALSERIFFLLLSVFLLMTMVSSFIGWSTLTTSTAIYAAATTLLHQQGVSSVASNPLIDLPALSNFRNVIVYMFLIGTLLAIVLGHQSFMRERKTGALQLILSRPISSVQLLAGKIMGIVVILCILLGITATMSIATSFFLPTQHLSGADMTHILFFYGLSFFYLFVFVLMGLFFAIYTRSESLALFIPVCLWVANSFVLPELITGQTPTALLNPVTMDQTTMQGNFFSFMQHVLRPVSLGLQYSSISSQLLSSSAESTMNIKEIFFTNSSGILLLVVTVGIALVACLIAIQQYSVSSDSVSE